MKAHLDLVFLSDTHELHREVEVPNGDVLIHAGDFTMFSKSLSAIEDFNDWLGSLPHAHKIVVPGNHEFFLEADATRRRLISNGCVLINEGIQVAGLHVWGSPMTTLYGGSFGLSSPAARRRVWNAMPKMDVLVTHGPPYGVLDRSPGQREHMGDPELLTAVRRVDPLIHAFGHVHGAYGRMIAWNTTFLNCALLGQDGAIANEPTVLRLPRKTRRPLSGPKHDGTRSQP